jgi:hypothetical protein
MSKNNSGGLGLALLSGNFFDPCFKNGNLFLIRYFCIEWINKANLLPCGCFEPECVGGGCLKLSGGYFPIIRTPVFNIVESCR